MLGTLVEIAISWLLLRLIYRKNLSALGIWPTTDRLVQLGVGLIIAAGCCTIYYLSFTWLAGTRWIPQETFTPSAFLTGMGWNLNSVLYEELIFRGALLYIAIQLLGTLRACILSAIAFGVYHWFTSGAFGNPVQMGVIFGMTAIWGYMFAQAFAKTQSLYLPIGLHFGWNLLNNVVFSQGPAGPQWLVAADGEKLPVVLSVVVFLFQVFAVPGLAFWYLQRIDRHKKANPEVDHTL